DILGQDDDIGGLRIVSNEPLAAIARTSSKLESDPASRAVATTFNAIPASHAIGNGQSAIAQGIVLGDDANERFKLYVVETAGEPLTYAISIGNEDGARIAQKTFYIAPAEERALDLAAEFPGVRAAHAVARVRGVNGNGRIIF